MIDTSNLSRLRSREKLTCLETHTAGEPTRIIINGAPELAGNTMMEKKNYLREHFDHYRRAIMLEPRGHRDMFGAMLLPPCNPHADLGVIFMDSSNYLNMCGHGSIGVATVAVETGLVKVSEPYTYLTLDTPAGLIPARVKVQDGRAREVSIQNVPAFCYKENVELEIEGRRITLDISFGGSFFALVNCEQIGCEICDKDLNTIIPWGMKILDTINHTIPIRHPYLDISTVDLVEFYGQSFDEGTDMKNVVIFGKGQFDRSPCGTGTSAKIAHLHAKHKLAPGDEFRYESITGTIFKGEIVGELDLLDGTHAIIPRITSTAYITGISHWLSNEEDPLNTGFLV